MKRFVFFIAILFCNVVIADTININWKNGDTTYEQSTCTIGGNLDVPTIAPTKYGYDFVGWNVRAAKELEYVLFSGSEYIDTGIKFDSNEIEYEIKVNFTGKTQNFSFGAAASCSSGWSYNKLSGSVLVRDYLTELVITIGNSSKQYKIGSGSINTYNLYVKKSSNSVMWSINNESSTGTLSGEFVSDKNIWLGRINAPENKCLFVGKIYYFRIKKDGVLVLDLIPALDPDGVVCFWDNISKTFFYNQGSGYLQAGPLKE